VKCAGFEPPDLENELSVAIIHDRDLRIRCLALVAIAEPATHAAHRPGIDRASSTRRRNQPARDVHLMNALVTDVAVAEIPEPVPVVMDQVGVIRLPGSRPKPDV